jgi:GABA(A) receptor-associated protein
MLKRNLTNSKFKLSHSVVERMRESNRVLSKYPDRIPVICEKGINTDIVDIDKNKFLVSCDLTCGQLIYVIRKRLKLDSEKAIFIMINGIMPQQSDDLYNLYNLYKDTDGFLYISYTSENVFGK